MPRERPNDCLFDSTVNFLCLISQIFLASYIDLFTYQAAVRRWVAKRPTPPPNRWYEDHVTPSKCVKHSCHLHWSSRHSIDDINLRSPSVKAFLRTRPTLDLNFSSSDVRWSNRLPIRDSSHGRSSTDSTSVCSISWTCLFSSLVIWQF